MNKYMNRAMLAPNDKINIDQVELPVLVSPKLDGIRCVIREGQLFTRAGKLIPNQKISEELTDLIELSHKGYVLDGELYDHGNTFQNIQSMCMNHDLELSDTFAFHAFDSVLWDDWIKSDSKIGEMYCVRLERLEKLLEGITTPRVRLIQHVLATEPEHVKTAYKSYLDGGYEGAMIRSLDGLYKRGRATLREADLLKIKPISTIDGKIVNVFFKKEMIDPDHGETDERGYKKRQFKKNYFRETKIVGSVKVVSPDSKFGETEFQVAFGKGFNAKDIEKISKEYIENAETLLGRWVEVEFMDIGCKDKPRLPKLVRFRDDRTLDGR